MDFGKEPLYPKGTLILESAILESTLQGEDTESHPQALASYHGVKRATSE